MTNPTPINQTAQPLLDMIQELQARVKAYAHTVQEATTDLIKYKTSLNLLQQNFNALQARNIQLEQQLKAYSLESNAAAV